jgi:hypothetical protein
MNALLDDGFFNNLLSGALGAILGALASIFALILTNRHTRLENSKVLDAQSRQFEVERQNYESQLDRDRDLARETRELEAISGILSFLQDDFTRNPLDQDSGSRISALCTLLWLNASTTVSDGWHAVTGGSDRGDVPRHPLAGAIVSRSAALALAQSFPDTAVRNGHDSRKSLLQDATGDSVTLFLAAVSVVGRKMLRWSRLSDIEKIELFDEFRTESTKYSSETLTIANSLVGGDSQRSLINDLIDPPEIAKLIEKASELGTSREPYVAEFALVILEEYVDVSTLLEPPAGPRQVSLRALDMGCSAVIYSAPSFIDSGYWVDETVDESHADRLVEFEYSDQDESGFDPQDYVRARRANE